jgi:hypothetical protein
VKNRLNANNIVMTLAVIIAAVLIVGFANVIATSPVGSTLSSSEDKNSQQCDSTGDADFADDCIHTVVDSFVKGEAVLPGKPFTSQVSIAPTLQGKDLIIVTQFREVSAEGTFGSWWTHKRTHWASEDTSVSTTRDLTSCAPSREGGYQMRTVLITPAGSRKPVVASAAASTPAAMVPHELYSVRTASLKQAPATQCQNSPQDEENVEYFNEQSFTDAYFLTVDVTETDYSITLNCPDPIPGFASDLHVFFETGDSTLRGECNYPGVAPASVISIPTTELGSTSWCTSSLTCEITIFAESASTGTIYSSTQMQVDISTMGTINPNLEPATLPICENPITQCDLELTGQCSITGGKDGELSLCEGPDTAICTPPPVSNTYAYNENVYFQASIH